MHSVGAVPLVDILNEERGKGRRGTQNLQELASNQKQCINLVWIVNKHILIDFTYLLAVPGLSHDMLAPVP